MPTVTALCGFITVAAVVLLVPGSSVVFVMTRSIERGRQAGIYSMLGLETGALLHAVATAAGLSALLAASDLAITLLRVDGAAYLLYLGAETILKRGDWGQSSTASSRRIRYFRDGVLIDLLNPKTALLFIAFLPQFVQVDRGQTALQLITFGLIFVIMAAACDSAYLLVAHRAARRIRESPRWCNRADVVSGGAYVVLAGSIALL